MKPTLKRVFIPSSLSFFVSLIVFAACSKQEATPINEFKISEKHEIELISQINSLTYVECVPGASKDDLLSNNFNPYDFAGITTGRILFKMLSDVQNNKATPESLKANFISQLRLELPESVLNVDTANYIKFEETLKAAILKTFRGGYKDFISKSMQIENIIISSDYLNDPQKKRMLIFSSVIRHIMGSANELFNSRKDETGFLSEFAECWLDKATELTNCDNCRLERFLCKVAYIQCYSVWAADCLLYLTS